MNNVALCWATKKRHIIVDNYVLCNPKKSEGYSTKNGNYNSLAISGIPSYKKLKSDKEGYHGDGIIPFLPIESQPFYINTKSVCRKCLKKYQSLFFCNE